MKRISSHNTSVFTFAKDYCPMTSGWQRAPYFIGRYGRGLVSKPAMSLKKSWGGLPLNDSTQPPYKHHVW